MGAYYDEVEIEDMAWDAARGVFHYPCPCGDRFEISRAQLAACEDVAACPSCSLVIRVVYDPLDFEDDADEDPDDSASESESESEPESGSEENAEGEGRRAEGAAAAAAEALAKLSVSDADVDIDATDAERGAAVVGAVGA